MGKIKINIAGTTVEVEAGALTEGIEKGEVNIETDQLIKKEEGQTIYSATDFETFKKNLADTEYKNGKKAGEEILIKTGREKYGLDFEGKTLDNFADAYRKKIEEESGKEPSKKIQELTADMEKLRGNLTTAQAEHEAYKGQQEAEKIRSKKDQTLTSFIPDKGLKVNKKLTVLALQQEGIDVDFDEKGNGIVTEKGETVKDSKTLAPVDPKAYITERLTSLELVAKADGGSGDGDDSGGGQASSYDKFTKEMEALGHSEGSAKYNEEMNKRISDKTLEI